MAWLCVKERKARAEESQERLIVTEEWELHKVLRRRRMDSSKDCEIRSNSFFFFFSLLKESKKEG
jgi:hypothetical protein